MCDDYEDYYCPECPHCQEQEDERPEFPASFGAPMGVYGPLVLDGLPGVGKSWMSFLYLERTAGRGEVKHLDLSAHEPGDMLGLPTRVDYRPPEWLRKMVNDKPERFSK